MTLPDDVEEAMADIALVFHWPLSEMIAMCPFELGAWHARAVARWDLMKGNPSGG